MGDARRKSISFGKSVGSARDVCTATSHMNHPHVGYLQSFEAKKKARFANGVFVNPEIV
jgi:hypothetical protein